MEESTVRNLIEAKGREEETWKAKMNTKLWQAI
jgi:hypothetical protein